MHKHIKAAKIAAASLIVNIIFSLILMKPLGAAGLALAGSIGGAVQMILTMREVGWNVLFEILKTKNTLYFTIGMVLFGLLFYILNQFLLNIIR
jgi:putative peptidoglycan lipid II flippase